MTRKPQHARKRADRQVPRSTTAGPPSGAFSKRSRPRWLLPLCLVAAAVVIVGFWWLRPTRRPNILLITVDTLRADHVGAYGDRNAVTPALDALAARGALFTNAICQVPLTLPSHASMLTGLLPPSHAIRDNVGFALASNVPTIAEQFRKAGYATAAFVSGYPLHRRFGLARGFELYDDRFPRGDDPTRAPYIERRADLTVRSVIGWLTGRGKAPDRPFFAWVHLFDPHAPYDPPEPFRTRFRERPYDGEIAFADSQIRALLDLLSKRDELSNTVVLAIADHGEGLGEHGEPTHGLFIYDSTIRIPLIVAGPGVRPGNSVTGVVRAMDVAPTLLDLATLTPSSPIDGRSLKAALSGRVMPPEGAYAESLFGRLSFGWAPLYGWRTERTMFIDAPRPEIYDLESDPRQTHDLSDSRQGDVTRFARSVRAVAAHTANRKGTPVPKEDRERFRSLGYVGGGAPIANPSLRDPKDMAAVAVRVEEAIGAEYRQPARAITAFREILAADPGNTLARLHLAMALSSERHFDEAIVELRGLHAVGNATAESFALLADCYRLTGRSTDAVTAAREAAARDARVPEAHVALGKALVSAGRPAEAAAAFDQALAVSPDDPDALLALADIALEGGDLPTARARLESLRARDAGDRAAALKLGVVRVRGGDIAGAIRLFTEVVNAEPANAEALTDLGGALAKIGRAADAIPYFERAIAAGARSTVLLNSLGFARLETGDRAGAADAFTRSLGIDREQPRIAEALRELRPYLK